MLAPDEVSDMIRGLAALGVPYMLTGATAAIIYGQPRVTNDLDVVLALDSASAGKLTKAFPPEHYYVPPQEVVQVELARALRGHFNLIHHASGYKADIYLVGTDPLHAWALPRRRQIPWEDGGEISVAPPEYVILRKLEYFREGGSTKHPTDIRAILGSTSVDTAAIEEWASRLGVGALWAQLARAG